jgi:flagellar biosynthesis/type III secretory pathway chaperone
MIVTTDGDQSFVYVNDYGFTHKYPRKSANSKLVLDQSCDKLKRAKIKQSVLDRLDKGRSMSLQEPCGIAGKNVRRGKSDEYAWISIDGMKHVYPDHVWKKKNESCHIPIIELHDTAYEAIPSGSAMTTSSECERGAGVPPVMWDNLYKLNSELAHLTELLTKEVNSLVTADMQLTQKLNEQKTQLAQHTSSLGSDRIEIERIQRDFQTVLGINKDTRLQLRTNWLHYIVWVLLAVTVVSILIHTARMNTTGMLAQIVVLIAALIAVYGVASWIDRYYL